MAATTWIFLARIVDPSQQPKTPSTMADATHSL
jgi:hypothetical protein